MGYLFLLYPLAVFIFHLKNNIKKRILYLWMFLLFVFGFGQIDYDSFLRLPGFFKIWDLILFAILFGGFAYFVKKQKNFLVINNFFHKVTIFLICILLIWAVRSYMLQGFSFTIKRMRHFLWLLVLWFLPAYFEDIKDIYDFLKMGVMVSLISSIIAITAFFNIFPPKVMLPHTLTVKTFMGFNRLYPPALVLNVPFFLGFLNYLIYENQKMKFKHYLCLVLLGLPILLTLARSWIGATLGGVVTTLLLNRFVSLKYRIRTSITKPVVGLMFFISFLLLSPLGSLLEERWHNMIYQFRTRENFLTGRWDRFVERIEFLSSRGELLWGMGFIHPEFVSYARGYYFPYFYYGGSSWATAESGHLNGILQFGILGYSLVLAAIVGILLHCFKIFRKSYNKFPHVWISSALISYIVFELIVMWASQGFINFISPAVILSFFIGLIEILSYGKLMYCKNETKQK